MFGCVCKCLATVGLSSQTICVSQQDCNFGKICETPESLHVNFSKSCPEFRIAVALERMSSGFVMCTMERDTFIVTAQLEHYKARAVPVLSLKETSAWLVRQEILPSIQTQCNMHAGVCTSCLDPSDLLPCPQYGYLCSADRFEYQTPI